MLEHPVSANIAFKDVEHLLSELGAKLESRSGDRVAVTLDGQSAVFHRSHHSLSKDDVVNFRHFLKERGVDPANYPL